MKKRFIKKIISGALSASMLFSASFFTFAAEDSMVEIEFKVGDSVLNINGTATEVETPYVAGEGTTLVPLRVITEAFGAKVDWEDATEKITLTYPDVNIILQIGNVLATVNERKEALLEAPVLSPNDVTMVPLRFISETFGADVSYDEETEIIRVVKKKVESQSKVVGITDMKRTGDGFYNWSIDTPTQMQMTDRGDDGLFTEFTTDNDSTLLIDIYNVTEDTKSFDEDFVNTKNMLASATLVTADKLTDKSENRYMHLKAKDRGAIIDIRKYYTNEYIYVITVAMTDEISKDEEDMLISLADSFKIGAIDSETYNLSTVHNVNGKQYRAISDEKYKIKFDIPAKYVRVDGSENEFRFYDYKKSSAAYVFLGIYSKSADATAETLAKHDRTLKSKNINPKIATVSDVSNGVGGYYYYTQTVSGSAARDSYTVDAFFEKGDYIYNLAVVQNGTGNQSEIDYILKSFNAEKLDSSKIGNILRNEPDETEIETKLDSYKFRVPASWTSANVPQAGNAMGMGIMHTITGSLISAVIGSDSRFKTGEIDSEIRGYKNHLLSASNEVRLVEDIKYETIGNRRYGYFVVQELYEGEICYRTSYLTCESGKELLFTLNQDEVVYGSEEITTLKNLLASIEKQ